MAHIVYGICGEGWGHAVRSSPIIDALRKKHAVTIVAGGKARMYFRALKPIRVATPRLHYRRAKVSKTGTAILNLLRTPLYAASMSRAIGRLAKLRPDVVVSDYEPFTAYAARLLGIPLILIGNHYVTTHTTLETPRRYAFARRAVDAYTRFITPQSRNVIVTSFIPLHGRNGGHVIPTPLRPDITRRHPTRGKHLLIYQTSASDKRLLRILAQTKEPCIVYGYGKRRNTSTMKFKAFNEKGFYDDLASCRGVIANGGHTLLSEAVWLRKPILSIPVRGHFEQTCNALCLEKMGCGMHAQRSSEHALREFIERIPALRKAYNHIPQKEGTHDAVRLIERIAR